MKSSFYIVNIVENNVGEFQKVLKRILTQIIYSSHSIINDDNIVVELISKICYYHSIKSALDSLHCSETVLHGFLI